MLVGKNVAQEVSLWYVWVGVYKGSVVKDRNRNMSLCKICRLGRLGAR